MKTKQYRSPSLISISSTDNVEAGHEFDPILSPKSVHDQTFTTAAQSKQAMTKKNVSNSSIRSPSHIFLQKLPTLKAIHALKTIQKNDPSASKNSLSTFARIRQDIRDIETVKDVQDQLKKDIHAYRKLNLEVMHFSRSNPTLKLSKQMKIQTQKVHDLPNYKCNLNSQSTGTKDSFLSMAKPVSIDCKKCDQCGGSRENLTLGIDIEQAEKNLKLLREEGCVCEDRKIIRGEIIKNIEFFIQSRKRKIELELRRSIQEERIREDLEKHKETLATATKVKKEEETESTDRSEEIMNKEKNDNVLDNEKESMKTKDNSKFEKRKSIQLSTNKAIKGMYTKDNSKTRKKGRRGSLSKVKSNKHTKIDDKKSDTEEQVLKKGIMIYKETTIIGSQKFDVTIRQNSGELLIVARSTEMKNELYSVSTPVEKSYLDEIPPESRRKFFSELINKKLGFRNEKREEENVPLYLRKNSVKKNLVVLCNRPYIEKETTSRLDVVEKKKATKNDKKGNKYKYSILDDVRNYSSYKTIASEFINLSDTPVLAKVVATNSIPQKINVIVQHQIYNLTSLLDENIDVDLFLVLSKNLSSGIFDSLETKKPLAKRKLLYSLILKNQSLNANLNAVTQNEIRHFLNSLSYEKKAKNLCFIFILRLSKLTSLINIVYLEVIKDIIRIQSCIRGYLQKNVFFPKYKRYRMEAIKKIQSLFKTVIIVKKKRMNEEEMIRKQTVSVTKIQSLVRGHLTRSSVKRIRQKRKRYFRNLLIFFVRCIIIPVMKAKSRIKNKRKMCNKIQTTYIAYKFQKHLQYQIQSRQKSAAIKIQSCIRMYLDCSIHKKQIKGIVRLQGVFRKHLAVGKYRRIRKSIVKIQSIFRMFKAKTKYNSDKRNASIIKFFLKSCIQRRLFKDLKLAVRTIEKYQIEKKKIQAKLANIKIRGAVTIQRYYRAYSKRRLFFRILSAIFLIQQKWKRYLDERKQEILLKAAISIQKNIRMYFRKKYFKDCKKSVTVIGKYWKAYRMKAEYIRILKSSIIIQNQFRKFLQMRKFRNIRKYIIKLQALYRGFATRKWLKEWQMYYQYENELRKLEAKLTVEENAAVKIQKIYRGYKSRLFISEYKALQNVKARKAEELVAAIKIQSFFRGRQDRQKVNKLRRLSLIEVENLSRPLSPESFSLTRNGRYSKLVEMIENGSILPNNERDSLGNTLLINAVKNNNESILRYLYFNGSCNVNFRNNDGKTALHYACIYGFDQLVDILKIEMKADDTIRDNDGRTCYYYEI